MKKILVALLVSLTACSAVYAKGYPPNERPMYGNVAKTPKMLEADAAFIAGMKESGMTRAEGSQDAVERAWKAMSEGDARLASEEDVDSIKRLLETFPE